MQIGRAGLVLDLTASGGRTCWPWKETGDQRVGPIRPPLDVVPRPHDSFQHSRGRGRRIREYSRPPKAEGKRKKNMEGKGGVWRGLLLFYILSCFFHSHMLRTRHSFWVWFVFYSILEFHPSLVYEQIASVAFPVRLLPRLRSFHCFDTLSKMQANIFPCH